MFGSSTPSQPFGGGAVSSAFGAGTPAGFGTPATSTFGGAGAGGGFTSFGQQAATPQPAFGSTFGTNTVTSTAPAFGNFGSSTVSAFGSAQSTFGTPQTQTVFGQPQQQQQQPQAAFGTPSGTSSFGTVAPTTSGFGGATGGLGFGGTATGTSFGTTAGPSLFGSTQPQTGTGFGTSTFGSPQTTGFGSTSLGTSTFGTTQPSLFGTTQQTPGFGATQPTSFGGTSSWLGTQTSQPSTSFSGFGSGGLFSQQKPTGFSFPTFGQQTQQLGQPNLQLQPQQTQPQIPIDEQRAFHESIFACCKFGDERDAIIANLNYIQASWGAGKGFYQPGAPPVVYNDKNILYRFKSVGYSFLFNDLNEDGQVVIHIKKPHQKVFDEEAHFILSLQNLLAKPNITFKVTASKALNEEMTVILLIAEDRVTLRRVLATELASALLQPQLKQQLDNMSIVNVEPKVKPSPEQLKSYLDSAPAGVDPRVWKKAQDDNPDPVNMIPIPFLGPEALKARVDAQRKENIQHFERLKLISETITSLQNRHANMVAELDQLKRRYTGLSHRAIMAVVRLLIIQKQGFPYQQEEDQLRKQMEELAKQLNSPVHFRGRLNEVMAHDRVHQTTLQGKGLVKYSMDGATLEQIQEFLALQQTSVQHLVASTKVCLDYMNRMKEEVEAYQDKRPSV